MELTMKLSGIQVLQEVFQLSRNLHVFILGEQVHVPETVDGNQGQIVLGLAQVVQGMSKFYSVGNQEIDVFYNKKSYETNHNSKPLYC